MLEICFQSLSLAFLIFGMRVDIVRECSGITFLFNIGIKQTWYWEKRWLFSIGNGAEIRPLETGRKSPGTLF